MLSRLKTLFHIIRSTKNWFAILAIRYGFKEKSFAKFRGGYILSVDMGNWKEYIYHAYLFSFLPTAKLAKDHI
ncbi:MAG: hypothetical protein M1170_02435, partial [Patescibacteria group bacterium]|nr:hypothetical protein [Patescibacteria group bacterium]